MSFLFLFTYFSIAYYINTKNPSTAFIYNNTFKNINSDLLYSIVEKEARNPKVNNSSFSINRTIFLSYFSNSNYSLILFVIHLVNKNEKLKIDEANPKFKIGFLSFLRTLKRLSLFFSKLINSLISEEYPKILIALSNTWINFLFYYSLIELISKELEVLFLFSSFTFKKEEFYVWKSSMFESRSTSILK